MLREWDSGLSYQRGKLRSKPVVVARVDGRICIKDTAGDWLPLSTGQYALLLYLAPHGHISQSLLEPDESQNLVLAN